MVAVSQAPSLFLIGIMVSVRFILAIAVSLRLTLAVTPDPEPALDAGIVAALESGTATTDMLTNVCLTCTNNPDVKLTPLLLASMGSTRETLEYLLAKGVDRDGVDNNGNNALGLAARHNTIDVVR